MQCSLSQVEDVVRFGDLTRLGPKFPTQWIKRGGGEGGLFPVQARKWELKFSSHLEIVEISTKVK